MSEIAAQAGCVLILSRPVNKGKFAYFMAIDEAECFEPAYPGDQLRVEVEVLEGSSKFGRGEGKLFIGERLISRTLMMFAVVDPQ
jgi:3-hydroxyacyl-[acyl-carrier-protein] dehydratase